MQGIMRNQWININKNNIVKLYLMDKMNYDMRLNTAGTF